MSDKFSIQFEELLKTTTDEKTLQKLIKKVQYEAQLVSLMRDRLNFFAALKLKREYKWPLHDVLIKFGLTKKTWTNYVKQLRKCKNRGRHFLDIEVYRQQNIFTEDQKNFLRHLINGGRRMPYRKMARLYNDQFPENKKCYTSLYRIMNPSYKIDKKRLNQYVPYCNGGNEIKMKLRKSRI